ncbi:MAG: hypothetical protein BWY28_03136 [bacterium ADurb.Bin236]|nr:MAG: hypothetical protein BWY28_03136 [bacterium ADurb.Bin236]
MIDSLTRQIEKLTSERDATAAAPAAEPQPTEEAAPATETPRKPKHNRFIFSANDESTYTILDTVKEAELCQVNTYEEEKDDAERRATFICGALNYAAMMHE